MENENEYTNESVLIDHQTSDLNLIVDKEGTLAYPMSEDGFCSMWAGCRANYGIESGKVVFEVNLEDYCECTDLPKDDPEPHSIRVGWSIAQSSLQLGENPFSFAFCNNGKKCTDKTFEDYGIIFEKGDSVAAYIDFETDSENIQFSFSKNGADLGIAYIINKKEFMEKCDSEFLTYYAKPQKEKCLKILFFPHVLSKNVVFELNFGQRVSLIGDEPFAPIKSDFFFIQKITIEKRFLAETPDVTNPEVIMLVGLPHVGKTKWALNYIKKNPKKSYSIIGISTIYDKMRLANKKPKPVDLPKHASEGTSEISKETASNTEQSSSDVSTQQVFNKAKTELLDKMLKCMNILIEMASHLNRNIIIDQPNVYESTRRCKMKFFENWRRCAIVIIPSNQIYLERISTAEKNGKEICQRLIDDMKANFSLPKICEYLDSVEYIELCEEESLKLIEIYNKEALVNRHNAILNRRLKTKQDIMKLHAGKLITINPNMQKSLGYRINTPFFPFQPSPSYPGDSRFSRFPSPNQPNSHRQRYSNLPYRMNIHFPNTAYTRPQTFGQPFDATAVYGTVNQWPAATSTELWTHQQQIAQYQTIPSPNVTNNIWAPALPISNNMLNNITPNINIWSPDLNGTNK